MRDGDGRQVYTCEHKNGRPTNMSAVMRMHTCRSCFFNIGIDLQFENKWTKDILISCPCCGDPIYKGEKSKTFYICPTEVGESEDFWVHTYRARDYDSPSAAFAANATHTSGEELSGRSQAHDHWNTITSALACMGDPEDIGIVFVPVADTY